jgi:plastocyanin
MEKPMKMRLLATLAVAVLCPNFANAEEWATLKLKAVYAGEAPKLAPLDGSKEPFCSKLPLPDERMIVGKDGELANFALILDMRKSKLKEDDFHPDLVKAPAKPVVVDNNGCLFKPHVAFVRTGQKVIVKNSDQCGHNAKLDPFSNDSINEIVPIGSQIELMFGDTERSNTTEITCTIHPWMKGHLIIRDHPYVGISGEDGVVTIENLPAGELTFKLVHENMKKSLDEGKLNGKKAKWSRGYMEVELKPGMNDLGTIEFDPALFND